MKRYVILLLMLVYGLSSTGASLYLHYCCGKLDDVSFSVQHKDGCDEKKPAGKKCCNNISIDLKLDTDQHPALKWISSSTEAVALTAPLPLWLMPSFPASAAIKSHWPNGPPDKGNAPPVYLKNCVFRI